MNKRRGISLPEVMIYVILCGLALMAISGLFMLARSAQQTTISGYMVSGEADTALRWIRRDFQETALVSIRSYPSDKVPNQAPGCSMVSPRTHSEKHPEYNVSKYGTPLWSKNVFYTLQLNAGARRGDLVRWEMPLTEAEKDFVPRPTTMLPSSMASGSTRRVILHNVLAPKTKLPPLPGFTHTDTDRYGGFRVQFVERMGSEDGVENLVDVNPGDTSEAQDAANNTRLVAIRLQILADDRQKASLYQLEFKVHPRY
jgi:hypothetical protein